MPPAPVITTTLPRKAYHGSIPMLYVPPPPGGPCFRTSGVLGSLQLLYAANASTRPSGHKAEAPEERQPDQREDSPGHPKPIPLTHPVGTEAHKERSPR